MILFGPGAIPGRSRHFTPQGISLTVPRSPLHLAFDSQLPQHSSRHSREFRDGIHLLGMMVPEICFENPGDYLGFELDSTFAVAERREASAATA